MRSESPQAEERWLLQRGTVPNTECRTHERGLVLAFRELVFSVRVPTDGLLGRSREIQRLPRNALQCSADPNPAHNIKNLRWSSLKGILRGHGGRCPKAVSDVHGVLPVNTKDGSGC